MRLSTRSISLVVSSASVLNSTICITAQRLASASESPSALIKAGMTVRRWNRCTAKASIAIIRTCGSSSDSRSTTASSASAESFGS